MITWVPLGGPWSPTPGLAGVLCARGLGLREPIARFWLKQLGRLYNPATALSCPTRGEQHLPRSYPRMRTQGGHSFPHPSTEQDAQNIRPSPKPFRDQWPLASTHHGPLPSSAPT